MEESEENITAEELKKVDSVSAAKKPKKRSMIERELETSLTSHVTSPAMISDALSKSRYGRARRLKTENDLIETQKNILAAVKSPGNESSPVKVQSPVYRMHASNSPQKAETPRKSTESYVDHQIDNLYQENISLSRFSDETGSLSPTKKVSKVYVRKDLIQKKDDDEPIMLIKNLFSPTKSTSKSSNRSLRNSLDRSVEKFSSKQNGHIDNASVVKTLNFDVKKNRKSKEQKRVLSKNELFELEAKCPYQVGDLAWARMGTFPFWPCMVTREPYSEMFVKKKLFGRVEHDIIHVTFFGDNGRRSWIVDNMLRNYLGLLEFEATREKFSLEDKKKDPKLYAAFYISEKKQALWNTSVEEAEIILREPKRLRFDIFNEMLLNSRATKKTQKSGKITRTDSDVSLSESLYDSLFSEDDVETTDIERSKNRSRNKSFDVSEVVTACLDNMAAKTGITKIQRQSHMDRWLQKAKSKTPEKNQMKATAPLKVEQAEKTPSKSSVPIKLEKTLSSKSKKKSSSPRDPKQKHYRFRNSREAHSKLVEGTPVENVNGMNDSNTNEISNNAVNSNCGFGVIPKVESLASSVENTSNDKSASVIITIDEDSSDAITKPKDALEVESTSKLIDEKTGDTIAQTKPMNKKKNKISNGEKCYVFGPDQDSVMDVDSDTMNSDESKKNAQEIGSRQKNGDKSNLCEPEHDSVMVVESDTIKSDETKHVAKEIFDIASQKNGDISHLCKPEQDSAMDFKSVTQKSDKSIKTVDLKCDSIEAKDTMEVDADSKDLSQMNEAKSSLKPKTVSSQSVEDNEVQLTDDNCNIKSDTGLKDAQNVVTIEASVTETKNDDTIDNEGGEEKKGDVVQTFKTKTEVAKIDFLGEKISHTNDNADTRNETLKGKNTSGVIKKQNESKNSAGASTGNSNVNCVCNPHKKEHFHHQEAKNECDDPKTDNLSEKEIMSITENFNEDINKRNGISDILDQSDNSESISQTSDEIYDQNIEDGKSVAAMDISITESNKSASILDASQSIESYDQNGAEVELSTNKLEPFLVQETNHMSLTNTSLKENSCPKSNSKTSEDSEVTNNNDTEIELFNDELNSFVAENHESSTREYVESPTFTQLLESEEFFRDVNESCQIIQNHDNQIKEKATAHHKSCVEDNMQSTDCIKSKTLNHDDIILSETKVTDQLKHKDNVESVLGNINDSLTQLNNAGMNTREENTGQVQSTDKKESKSDEFGKNLQNNGSQIDRNFKIFKSTNKIENKLKSGSDTSNEGSKSIVQIEKEPSLCSQDITNDNLNVKLGESKNTADNNLDIPSVNEDCEFEESDDEPSPEYESLDEDITEDFRKHMMSIEKNITDKRDEEQIVKICNEIAEKAKLSPTKYSLDLPKVQERRDISPKHKKSINFVEEAKKGESIIASSTFMNDPEFMKFVEIRQDALIDENPHLTYNEVTDYLYKTWLYEKNPNFKTIKNYESEQGTTNNQSDTSAVTVRNEQTNINEATIDQIQADVTVGKVKRHSKRYDLKIIDTKAKEKQSVFSIKQGIDRIIDSEDEKEKCDNQRTPKMYTRRSQESDLKIYIEVKTEALNNAEGSKQSKKYKLKINRKPRKDESEITAVSNEERDSKSGDFVSPSTRHNKKSNLKLDNFDGFTNERKTDIQTSASAHVEHKNEREIKLAKESKSLTNKREDFIDIDKSMATVNTRHKERDLKLNHFARENKAKINRKEAESITNHIKEHNLLINSDTNQDENEDYKDQAGAGKAEINTGLRKNNEYKMNGNATLKKIERETTNIYRTRLSSSSPDIINIQSSKIEKLRNSCEYDPKVVIIPLERDKNVLLKDTLIKTTTHEDKKCKLRHSSKRLSLRRDRHKNQTNETIIIDGDAEIKLEVTDSLKTETILKEETVILNKAPKKINIENGAVETNIPEQVMVNGFHHANRKNADTPDLTDDTDFDIDAVSLNSEDSGVSYSSVESVPRRNLRSRPERNLENALKNPNFLNYLEIQQDYLMDQHPELNEDEVLSYIYKTWQYDEDLKSDCKKIEEAHNSSLVKGLKQETPSRKHSNRSQPKTSIENLFRERYEKCRKTFDFNSENGTSESYDVKQEVTVGSELLSNSTIKTEEDTDTQETRLPEIIDLTSKTDNEAAVVKDKLSLEEALPIKSESCLTPKRTLRSQAITSKIQQKETNDVEIVEDKTTIVTKVKVETEFDSESIDSEDSEVPLRQLRSKVIKDRNIQDFTLDKKAKTESNSIEPIVETTTKEEVDEIASTISDNEPLVQKKKKVEPKSYDDPEFIKYMGQWQDALIDENPQLTQNEIVGYLYKAWLYEEKTKPEFKKNEELEQDNLVKGLNDVAPPKKIRRRPKAEKLIEDLDVVPKEKPRRRIAQPFYNENISDFEDELEVFEIFKTEKETITAVSKAEMEKDKVKSPSTKATTASKDTLSPKTLKIEPFDATREVKPEPVTDEIEQLDEAKYVDAIELYFTQLTQPKPNIFKGLIREKVCEICMFAGNLVKCKGCNAMFHPDCVKRENEVIDVEAVPTKGRKKKKKPRSRKTKSIEDSESHSDGKSRDVSADVSVEDIVPLEIGTFDAESFEAQLAEKMKEMLDTAETNYDSYSSDDGIDWKDAVAGKCEIVEVKLKRRSAPVDYSDYKCNNCQVHDIPVCFVCKLAVSKTGLKMRQKCHVAHCYKYYHLECLDHWPQTQFNSGEPSKSNKKISEFFEALTCPRHVCHTCVSDDPRGCKTRFSGDKLAKCVRCPATYHSFSKCLPAGSQILTASHIICPRHCDQRQSKAPCHVNTGWCFICAQGGSLICCEYCPTSFHAECLNIKPPEGNYMCEDCETGRLPLYGEMVWVKLGHYRWWPGMILHPSEIPENIMAAKHGLGEFVVRFFGQYDHYWVNRGRVFPYQEGDSGRISGQKSKIDAAFTMAIEHAQRAYAILKNAKPNDEESVDIASSLLPPHYVKLKSNKPCGSLCGKKIEDPSLSLTQCECNPDEAEPCGPYSQCLNRMLLTECGPTCRAGDRCNNRAFEKRLYPKLVPYRTPQRGWGLKTLEKVKGGQFVIEYVGELIDEEEFKRRMKRKHEIRDENFYFLTLDKERMIDAGPKGNLARFMNHCCEPNCETQKWTVLGDVRVGLFAIDDIPANSEVTFNYNLQCAGIEKKRCLCGAKRCSGYIGAKPKQDESNSKKNKDGKLPVKRTYKKKKIEQSPSTTKLKSKRPLGRPPKPKELTEIEKDLLIIKNATNGASSDESSRTQSEEEKKPRILTVDNKYPKSLKRKRVSISISEVSLCNGLEPSVKRLKCEKSEVGD